MPVRWQLLRGSVLPPRAIQSMRLACNWGGCCVRRKSCHRTGMNELRRVLNRGEAVNALKRAIYTGRISPAQAKRVDEMQAVADALSLMANIVMAWNTSQMQAVPDRWAERRPGISPGLVGEDAAPRG